MDELQRAQAESAAIRRAYLREKWCREALEEQIMSYRIAKDNLQLRLNRAESGLRAECACIAESNEDYRPLPSEPDFVIDSLHPAAQVY